jgi:hypothetical protein
MGADSNDTGSTHELIRFLSYRCNVYKYRGRFGSIAILLDVELRACKRGMREAQNSGHIVHCHAMC